MSFSAPVGSLFFSLVFISLLSFWSRSEPPMTFVWDNPLNRSASHKELFIYRDVSPGISKLSKAFCISNPPMILSVSLHPSFLCHVCLFNLTYRGAPRWGQINGTRSHVGRDTCQVITTYGGCGCALLIF